MKLLIVCSILLFAMITAGAPAKNNKDKKINDAESYVKYKSRHDIVSILVPLNFLLFDENEPEKISMMIFFVEADVNADGTLTYQGLYVFRDGKATKLLDNGRDIAAFNGDKKQVFFGAQDGLYEYNMDTKEAVKYGSVTDSIIGIAKTNTSDTIYILTEDHELYTVTDAGNIKTKVEEVVNAQEIVLDWSDNLYFYGEDKKAYVLNRSGLKKISGLPSNPIKVKLIKTSFDMEESALFMVDNIMYTVYSNGTSKINASLPGTDTMPTAYFILHPLFGFVAYNKKIYEYNVVAMIFEDILSKYQNQVLIKG